MDDPEATPTAAKQATPKRKKAKTAQTQIVDNDITLNKDQAKLHESERFTEVSSPFQQQHLPSSLVFF